MSLLSHLFHRKQSVPFDQKSSPPVTPVQPFQSTRTYVVGSDYQLPKDAEEDNRLNFQHYALFHAIGNHYVAPIHPPLQTVLDVGTGTGIWAVEMARLLPTATVVGVDMTSTSFKQLTQTHKNCLLREGNVLNGLPFPDQFFSFTHQRLLVVAIPAQKWPNVIHELVRVTCIGGWVELVEIDSHMSNAGPATAKMQTFMETVSHSMGISLDAVRHLDDLLRQEGLQEVEKQPITIPVGEWGGRVGSLMKQDLLAVMNAFRGRYCTQAHITGADFDNMVGAMAREWESNHPSCTFYAVYGKRVA